MVEQYDISNKKEKDSFWTKLKKKFIPENRPSEVFKKTYWEEYYAGADVGIFIGDVWVDDVVSIQYSEVNNKSPIYGYMSEDFNAVAKGTKIVQGQFSIAFREVGYLGNILDRYRKQNSSKIVSSHNVSTDIGETTILERVDLISGQRKAAIASHNTIIEKGLRGFYDKDPKNYPEEERWAYQQERQIFLGWLHPDKFGYISTSHGDYIDVRGFDIFLTFGDVFELDRSGTVEIINGCHITSRSLICEPTGEPIVEVYNFFAKGLNKSTSKFKYFLEEKTPTNTPSRMDEANKQTNLNNRIDVQHDIPAPTVSTSFIGPVLPSEIENREDDSVLSGIGITDSITDKNTDINKIGG